MREGKKSEGGLLKPPTGSYRVNVSNGVRKCGILSPKLFAIYVDDLSHELTLCKSGCYIDDQCMNHVMYADDICLMAPSAIGMQKMLDMCFDFNK